MTQLSTKIKLYAKANGVSSIDFLSDVRLQNDTGTDYIKEWNLDIAEPTAEQLATYEDAGNTDEDAEMLMVNRRREYPKILDCIHALLDGGDTLTDLQTKRTAVKDKYPKS